MNEKTILLFLIFISLFLKSIQNEQKKFERIEGTIKLIISSITEELNGTSLTFGYKKYNISFNKFKLIKPYLNRINISKENSNNEIFYKINNLNITYMFDLGIKLFANPENIIIDKSRFIIANFKEIIFKFIDDYNIEFISSEIDSIYFFSNNKLNNLDFFSDFNNKKNCTIYESEKEPTIISDTDIEKKMMEIFNNIFKFKIKEIEKSINMLSYDIINIINNFNATFKIEDGYVIDCFQIKKLKTKVEYMTYNKADKSIVIDNLIIEGELNTTLFDEFYQYSFKCGKQFNRYKTISFVFNKNKSNNYIQIKIDDCDYEDNIPITIDDQTELLKEKLKEQFPILLNQDIDKYYKEIF